MYFLLAQDPADNAWEIAVAEIPNYETAQDIMLEEQKWQNEHEGSVKFKYLIVAGISEELERIDV